MSDTYGKSVTLTIFGESHGPAVGATVTGLAPGCLLYTSEPFSNSIQTALGRVWSSSAAKGEALSANGKAEVQLTPM